MTQLLNIEVDGRAVQVPHGSTVLDAANKLGIYVPHFCYHKKLSIAANCRMCLVHVEGKGAPVVGDGAGDIVVDFGDPGGKKRAGERADVDRLVGLLRQHRFGRYDNADHGREAREPSVTT